MARSAPTEHYSKKSAFPAKAGIHLSSDGAVEEWVPAFAGNADFWLVTSSLNALILELHFVFFVPSW